MSSYTVEFWPGKVVKIDDANDEDDALFKAIEKLGFWPGGSESTAHGEQFKVWVRKV